MCITETIKVDYDNDKSDNCDYNFGTFSDFGVKNDQKVYTMPERKHFFTGGVP